MTSDQIRQWIAQGRSNGQTLASFESAPWKPLTTFPEFADVLRTAVPPPFPQAAATLPGAQTNTLAVTGLILCIVGTCCSPLTLVGLILCVIGLSQIQKNPQLYTTTKVVPIIGIVIALVYMIAAAIAISSGALNHIMRNFPR